MFKEFFVKNCLQFDQEISVLKLIMRRELAKNEPDTLSFHKIFLDKNNEEKKYLE